MKLVVLGRTGFIGEAIFEHYQSSGTYEVSGFNSSELNLADFNAADHLAKILDGNTTLVISARAGKNLDSLKTFEQDIAITNNVARAIAIIPVRKCVYFSSIAVYGEAVENVNISEDTETSPTSLYGISRMAGDLIYCVAILGITGTQGTDINKLKQYLQRVNEYSQCAYIVGFGIK